MFSFYLIMVPWADWLDIIQHHDIPLCIFFIEFISKIITIIILMRDRVQFGRNRRTRVGVA